MPIDIASILVSQGVGLLVSTLAKTFIGGPSQAEINQAHQTLEVFLQTLTKEFSSQTEEAIRAAFLDHSFEMIKTDTEAATRLFNEYLHSLFSEAKGEISSLHSATQNITQAYARLKQHCDNILQTPCPKATDMSKVKILNKKIEISLVCLYTIANINLFILAKRFQLFPSLIDSVNKNIDEYKAYTRKLVSRYTELQAERVSYKGGIEHSNSSFLKRTDALLVDGDLFLSCSYTPQNVPTIRIQINGRGDLESVPATEIKGRITFTHPNGKTHSYSSQEIDPSSSTKQWLIKILQSQDLIKNAEDMIKLWETIKLESKLSYQIDQMQQGILEVEEVDLTYLRQCDLERKNALLFLGITLHNASFIAKLLDKGANVNALRPSGKSVLHEAVRLGDVSIVKVLLQKGAIVHLLTQKDALFLAYQKQNEEQSPENLRKNQEILAMLRGKIENATFRRDLERNKEQVITALHTLKDADSIRDLASTLKKQIIDIYPKKEYYTFMTQVISNDLLNRIIQRNPEQGPLLIKDLLSITFDGYKEQPEEERQFCVRCLHNLIKLALEGPAEYLEVVSRFTQDEEDKTQFILAIKNQDTVHLTNLLKRRSFLDYTDEVSRNYILHFVLQSKNAPFIQILLRSVLSLEAYDTEKLLCFLSLTTLDNLTRTQLQNRLAKTLYSYYANPNHSSVNKSQKLATFLKCPGFQADYQDPISGETLLHVCLQSENPLQDLRFLLDKGADIFCKNHKGLSPYELVNKGECRHAEEITKIFRANIDRMLTAAVYQDDPDRVLACLQAGANIETNTCSEGTLLHQAIKNKARKETIQHLLT